MFKVLIAEDEPLIRKGIIYCTDWARLNCGIPLEASNGEEAAEMIRQHRPDIVLLDVNMPLMDGLDALFQTRLSLPLQFLVMKPDHSSLQNK